MEIIVALTYFVNLTHDINMPAGVEEDTFKSVLRDVKRKLSTTERRNSRQENRRISGSGFSSLKSTPLNSNQPSPSRSPFTQQKY